jgi:ATP-binding cassette subfamily F protein uup
MTLLRLQDVTLSYGSRTLVEDVDFHIKDGERVCLVGRNGTGKTSFLRMIYGDIAPDEGTITTAPQVHLGYLPQKVPRNWNGTIESHVLNGMGSVGELLSDYKKATEQSAEHPDDEGLTEEIQRLAEQIDAEEGWERRQHADEMMSVLNLDPTAEVASLSGGQSRRVLLARALAARPEILILDEPTNHLDIESIKTLEHVIEHRAKTIIFVSHDREFVQNIATRIVEIDRGNLFDYPGDYETFLRRRDERLDEEESQRAEFDKKLQREEDWMKQGVKARRKRNQGRVRRLQSMRQQRKQRRNRLGEASIEIQEAEKSGKKVITAEHVTVTPGNSAKPVVDDFSIKILRGDRVGVIGPNGCGKTTLLRTLLGDLSPDSGTIEHGTNLQIAYFDQHRERLDPDAKVWEVVADGSDRITVNGNNRHVMGWLNDFLFPAHRARGPVSVLSGGERHRLLLAKMFAKPSNLLVLDEPTNDLDIETLELLENRLADFDGTVLVVSHDRAFLNATVTSILAYEGDGHFEEYVGGYDDYERQRPALDEETTPEKAPEAPRENPPKSSTEQEQPARRKKLSNKERAELRELPDKIASLEQEEEDIHERLGDPELYKEEPEKVSSLNERLEEISAEHEAALERWLELEERS